MPDPLTPDALDALEARIDAWLAVQLAENPVVAAVDRDVEPGERRWFVRLRGEEKDIFTIWFHLRQRTLHYETYVMPAPEENHGALSSTCCAATCKLYGAAFAIGDEDAVFLVGQLANDAVDRRRARPHPRVALRSASSSTSAPPCASASRRGSRADRRRCISIHLDPSCASTAVDGPVGTRSGKR